MILGLHQLHYHFNSYKIPQLYVLHRKYSNTITFKQKYNANTFSRIAVTFMQSNLKTVLFRFAFERVRDSLLSLKIRDFYRLCNFLHFCKKHFCLLKNLLYENNLNRPQTFFQIKGSSKVYKYLCAVNQSQENSGLVSPKHTQLKISLFFVLKIDQV